jgi:SAM-dependent methyltransferase
LARSDLYAPEHHWGDAAIDARAHDLPALKIQFLLDALPTRGRVVEVGCGSGRILNTIAAYRPDLELSGCDIRALDGAHPKFDFRLVDPDDSQLPYEVGSVDAVVMFDVLEHVVEPSTMLAAAHAILRPSGVLISFTPLEGQAFSMYKLYRRLLGDDLYITTKEHVQSFSETDLRSLLTPAGFQIDSTAYAYHLMGHVMDATLFALMKVPAIRKRFWADNPFYAEATRGAEQQQDSALARALRAANALAYAESRLLRHRTFCAAGLLFTASPRAPFPPRR